VHISKAHTFRNVIYNTLVRGTTLTCQLLASTVVARNLSAADMGVVGFAGIIIGFLGHFSDCGVGNAAIRRPVLEPRNWETAFTLKVFLGAGAFAVTMLIAPFAWHFCDHPAAGNVTRFLALNFFISNIGFLPLVQLTREMNYKALVIPGIINAVVRCGLAVTLILCGWKFWAVVVADVGANLAGNLAIQCVRKIPLRFRFDRPDAGEFLRFGLPLVGTGVLIFLIFNLSNFLVSATMGIAMLGYYTLAFNWGSFVCGLLSDTVNTVLFPTFAAIQGDPVKLRRWYLKSVDLAAFVAVVANTALLANAHAFLVIFLGKGTDKWLPAAVTLQILCFYGIIRAVTEPLGNCLMARNQTRTLLHAAILCGAVLVGLLLLTLSFRKIEWVALAVLVSYVAQAIIYVPYLRRDLSITVGDVIKQLWPVVPALLAGWGATHLLFTARGGSLFTLAGRGLFTAAVVALTHGIFTRFRCFQEARELLFQKFTGRLAGKNPPANL
jgi:O-antigen/teichoic acid export membrane protein